MKVYVHKDGKQYGPFTVEQLRKYVGQGNFTKDDHACHDGQNWVKIAQVPGFAEATQPAATPSPTTPRRDQVVQEKAVEQQLAPADASSLPSKKKKIILWSSMGGIAMLLVAGLLIWLLGNNEADPESNQTSAETPPAKTAEVAKIDLDDNETRNRIIAEAIDWTTLKKKGREELGFGMTDLVYAPNEQTPYSGWVIKRLMIDWRDHRMGLTQYKDGNAIGPSASWHHNGQKSYECTYKDAKLDGPAGTWYSTGQKASEQNWKDGKLVTAVAWKPNGEKCPETNVVNGNGVWVAYWENGRELARLTYKDGE